MKKIAAFAAAIFVVLSVVPAWPHTTRLEIVGTGDGLDILRALADHYSKLNQDVLVEIPPSIGSGGGIAAVGSGRAILGRIARELSSIEREAGIVYRPIAHLPSSFFAHPSANVQSVTAEQLVKIYTAQITNWKEVGGTDLRIRVIRREDIDSTLTTLRRFMPGWKALSITERSKMATSTQEAIDGVRSVMGAIGFGPYSRELENGLSVLKVDNKHPLEQSYPSSNELALIYIAKSLTREARDFIQFTLSEEGQKIISELGGVPK